MSSGQGLWTTLLCIYVQCVGNSFAIICPSFNSFLDKFTNYLKILLSKIQYCEFSGIKIFTGYSSAVSFNVPSISLHTKCGSRLDNFNIFLSNFPISISFSFVPLVHDLVSLPNHYVKANSAVKLLQYVIVNLNLKGKFLLIPLYRDF